MATIAFGGICAILGALGVVFSGPLTQHIARQQSRIWRYEYDDLRYRSARVVVVVVGCGAIVFGVLAAMGLFVRH
jgi:hypothetical protein